MVYTKWYISLYRACADSLTAVLAFWTAVLFGLLLGRLNLRTGSWQRKQMFISEPYTIDVVAWCCDGLHKGFREKSELLNLLDMFDCIISNEIATKHCITIDLSTRVGRSLLRIEPWHKMWINQPTNQPNKQTKKPSVSHRCAHHLFIPTWVMVFTFCTFRHVLN